MGHRNWPVTTWIRSISRQVASSVNSCPSTINTWFASFSVSSYFSTNNNICWPTGGGDNIPRDYGRCPDHIAALPGGDQPSRWELATKAGKRDGPTEAGGGIVHSNEGPHVEDANGFLAGTRLWGEWNCGGREGNKSSVIKFQARVVGWTLQLWIAVGDARNHAFPFHGHWTTLLISCGILIDRVLFINWVGGILTCWFSIYIEEWVCVSLLGSCGQLKFKWIRSKQRQRWSCLVTCWSAALLVNYGNFGNFNIQS